MSIRTLAVLALLAAPVVGTDAARAQPERPQSGFVTSEAIRAGEVSLEMQRIGTVRLVDVMPGGDAAASCNVHLPSVRAAIRQLPEEPSSGETTTINLQIQNQNGELWCYGTGGGCTIVIKLP